MKTIKELKEEVRKRYKDTDRRFATSTIFEGINKVFGKELK